MKLITRKLSTRSADFESQWQALRHWSEKDDAQVEQKVADILHAVRSQGDEAVLSYTRQWDRLEVRSMDELVLHKDSLFQALDSLPAPTRQALETAATRIRHYHQAQWQAAGRSWMMEEPGGSRLGQKVTPLDRVGIYVPGGKAAYPSSVLMNAIPAQVAGVPEIIMVVPTPGGERNALVLAAAALAGVDKVFTIGGAQAVAALAYGTATIPKVDKITGPGNAYVACAKRRVFGQVGIDMIAGPSEILVIADGSTPPEWVAMDLFSQAEHDEWAQSILLCPDAAYIDAVESEMQSWIGRMPRAPVIAASLNGRGALVHTRSMEEACELSNRIAPEHLEIAAAEPSRWEPLLRHAGAIFMGGWTSESLGDYCAGPNHVLPTSGTARFSSPLGVMDFQKRSSLIEVSPQDAAQWGQVASVLARGEGLQGHALAAEMRVQAVTPGQQSEPLPARPLQQWLSNRVAADVRSLQAYRVADARGMVKLDIMENPHVLPLALRQELGMRLADVALNRYPAHEPDRLKQALRSHHGWAPDQPLVLGNGSDELISLLTLAVSRSGASVMAPQPGFVMYALAARMQGLKFVGVDLQPDFSLDIPAMVQALRHERPALLWLAYPNNPTGTLWDSGDIETLIRTAATTGTLVIMDEAYQPFATDQTPSGDAPSGDWQCADASHWMRQHEHVVCLRTLSKVGLAGLRIGYLAAHADLVDLLEKLRPPFNVGTLHAEAACFALEHAEVFAQQAELIRHERERLVLALGRLPELSVVPSQGNMLLVRFPDAAEADQKLKSKGILVKNLSGSHRLLTNMLRITVGTPQENTQLLEALGAS